MTGFFRKVCEKVSDHLDFIRYLWPAKWASTRFKFLNFLSANHLMTGVNAVNGAVWRLMSHSNIYESSVAVGDTLTPEQMDRVLHLICKDIDCLKKRMDDLYKI